MILIKTVLITGAGTGIGASTALKFAKLGYNVVINYNNSFESAKEVEEKCIKLGVDTLLIKADITREDEIQKLVQKSIEKFGKINCLVNNAGISIDTLFEEKTKENFMKTLETNLVGTFLVSKYVAEYMLKEKEGVIINISSTNGIDKYFPMCLDYDASKAGLISLTHNLSMQYAPYIRVNCVAPGWIGTENELSNVDDDYKKLEEEKIFVKRIGTPDEVSNVIAFLASDEASYINNSIIRVDGGTY